MKLKHLASGAVVASLSLSPLSPISRPASADTGDVVAGLIVGAIIGGAVANENGKKKTKAKVKSTKSKAKAKAPSISAEQRAENIAVQDSLNHFGWNVGTADGSLGPKSKSAIKEYQAFMGYPATGDLSAEQRNVLVTSYHRSQAGGAVISEIVSGSVYGLRGVLIAQAQEMAPGGTMAAAGPITVEPAMKPGSVAAAAAAALPSLMPEDEAAVKAPAAPILPSAPGPVVTPVAAPVPESTAPVVAPLPVVEAPVVEPPAVETAEATGPGLPTFLVSAPAVLLSSSCDSVTSEMLAKGEATTASAETARLVLDQQFCGARAEAIATGESLAAQVAGFSPAQIAQQCDALAPVLTEHVSALSSKPYEEVIAGVNGFIKASGMSVEQLTGTAKVCLGVGYQADNNDVAIGAGLLLTALGQEGYGELLGYHLISGQGADADRSDLAETWYERASRGPAVFNGDAEGRAALLVDAVYALNGHPVEPKMPSFTIAPQPKPSVAPAADPIVAPAPKGSAAPLIEATGPAPLPGNGGEVSVASEGPGGDAIRMGAEIFRAAMTIPFQPMVAAE